MDPNSLSTVPAYSYNNILPEDIEKRQAWLQEWKSKNQAGEDKPAGIS